MLVLVDCRRGPAAEDWEMMEALSLANQPFSVVLTKADTVGPNGDERPAGDPSSPASLPEADGASGSSVGGGSGSGGCGGVKSMVVEARAAQVLDELRRWKKCSALPLVHAVSARTGAGVAELRLAVAEAAGVDLAK